MPGLSENYEKYLLWWMFKQTAFVAVPTELHVSLHSANPTDSRTTAAGNELTGNGYARAQLDPDPNSGTNTNWNSIAGGVGTEQQISNKLDIEFPPASADWNSGSAIQYFGLWAVASGGTDDDYLGNGTITGGGVVVLSGNTLKFLGGTPGNLVFSMD